MNTLEPILVIGGTRGTGLLIARLLHRQGQRVRLLARDYGRALLLFDSSVQVLEGDVTKLQTLGPSTEGVQHIIFTAGCRSGYPVREPHVKAVSARACSTRSRACKLEALLASDETGAAAGEESRRIREERGVAQAAEVLLGRFA